MSIEANEEREDRLRYEGLILEAVRECWVFDDPEMATEYITAVSKFYNLTIAQIREGITPPTTTIREAYAKAWARTQGRPHLTRYLHLKDAEEETISTAFWDLHITFDRLKESHVKLGLVFNLGKGNSSPYDPTKGGNQL
jgi:hypothetical protein